MIASHVDLLVEEPSAEACLRELIPKLLKPEISYDIHPFQGKPDLIKNLPSRLEGYKRWIPADWKIVILIDRDDDDCLALKQQINRIISASHLHVKQSHAQEWSVVCRIAVEELEAWFFGDWNAVRSAFPKCTDGIPRRAAYRDSDNIRGGTWEQLERELKKVGYFRTGFRKIEFARRVSRHLDPDRNSSRSFQNFRDVIRQFHL